MYHGHAAHISPPDLTTHTGPGSSSLRNSVHGVPNVPLPQQQTVASVGSYVTTQRLTSRTRGSRLAEHSSMGYSVVGLVIVSDSHLINSYFNSAPTLLPFQSKVAHSPGPSESCPTRMSGFPDMAIHVTPCGFLSSRPTPGSY